MKKRFAYKATLGDSLAYTWVTTDILTGPGHDLFMDTTYWMDRIRACTCADSTNLREHVPVDITKFRGFVKLCNPTNVRTRGCMYICWRTVLFRFYNNYVQVLYVMSTTMVDGVNHKKIERLHKASEVKRKKRWTYSILLRRFEFFPRSIYKLSSIS